MNKNTLKDVYLVKSLKEIVGYILPGQVYTGRELIGKRVILVPVIIKSDLPNGILKREIEKQWKIWIKKYLDERYTELSIKELK